MTENNFDLDALLERVDVFNDSQEVAGSLEKIALDASGDGYYPYWLKEAATHIKGQHELLVQLRAATVKRIRELESHPDTKGAAMRNVIDIAAGFAALAMFVFVLMPR